MNFFGWLCYWMALITGYLRENFWRGWNQGYRGDFNSFMPWNRWARK
jgi:hypothetical protein